MENTYRVNMAITVDVKANDSTQAEVKALEWFGHTGASVLDVLLIDETITQPGLFDEQDLASK